MSVTCDSVVQARNVLAGRAAGVQGWIHIDFDQPGIKGLIQHKVETEKVKKPAMVVKDCECRLVRVNLPKATVKLGFRTEIRMFHDFFHSLLDRAPRSCSRLSLQILRQLGHAPNLKRTTHHWWLLAYRPVHMPYLPCFPCSRPVASAGTG
jgi:hypothetical protein